MATAITRSGQVTIPKDVRDRLGLEPGTMVDFETAPDGRVVLVKVAAAQTPDRFARWRGRAGEGMTTDQIMAMTRGEDDHHAG